MTRWTIREAAIDSDELERLLGDGWEPFAVRSYTVEGEGRYERDQVTTMVVLRRESSVLARNR